ncbi:MAG TPA: hypothetical protein VGM76_04280 [Lacipirellulaceae bacterium]|jgi:hypothetical protein
MIGSSEMNGAAIASQSAILMARIVDAAGRSVERSDIASVRYLILEIDAAQPDVAVVVTGHDRVRLDVDAVIYDALEFGGLWSIDELGYNFRHEIVVVPTATFPKPHAHYQVVYELVSAAGQTASIRFTLRIS